MKKVIRKWVDNKLKKYGYLKVKDDKFAVAYEKNIEEYNYVHHIELMHKKSGKHLIFSYDTKCNKSENGEYINNAVGMIYPIARLLTLRSYVTF